MLIESFQHKLGYNATGQGNACGKETPKGAFVVSIYQLPSQINDLGNERLAVLCKQVGVHVHYYHSTHPEKLMHQLTSPGTPAHQPYSLLQRIQMTDCTDPAAFGHVLKSFFDMQQQAR